MCASGYMAARTVTYRNFLVTSLGNWHVWRCQVSTMPVGMST